MAADRVTLECGGIFHEVVKLAHCAVIGAAVDDYRLRQTDATQSLQNRSAQSAHRTFVQMAGIVSYAAQTNLLSVFLE